MRVAFQPAWRARPAVRARDGYGGRRRYRLFNVCAGDTGPNVWVSESPSLVRYTAPPSRSPYPS
jgi:hypothetical protein